MSVIITMYSDKFIMMCADRQETNMNTGEVYKDAVTKIEKWTSTIAVGASGNKGINRTIKETVYNYVTDEGIEKFTLEEIGDAFCDMYYAALEELPDMPREATFRKAVRYISEKSRFVSHKTDFLAITLEDFM